MLLFCLEVFTEIGTKSNAGKAIIICYSIATLAFIIFAIWTGILVEDLTTWIWGGAIILSIFVYGWTMIAALRIASKLEKGPDKVSTYMISVSPISIMFVFVMFFIDRMVGGNFSPFYYAGWAFVIVSLIFMYIGVIRPKFLFKQAV